MKKTLLIVLAGALVGGSIGPAYGDITLTLSSGATTLSVTDGGTGVITFIGSVGGFWDLNVDTAISKPVIGGQFDPQLEVNILSAHSAGNVSTPATLIITVTSDGFGPLASGIGHATFLAGGTTDGSVNAFGKVAGSILPGLGPFLYGPYAATANGAVSGLSSTFSLYERIVINHPVSRDGSVSSGDFVLSVVPEPSTVIAGALLLLPFGAAFVSSLRKPNRSA